MRSVLFRLGLCALAVALAAPAMAQAPGEEPNLKNRLTQDDIANGGLPDVKVRDSGLLVFTTPFNKLDGYGDGPIDPADTTTPGGRPTLQGNGTLLRINGLDAQTCLECHTLISNATIPATLGIGGSGGSNANAIIMTQNVDPNDDDLDGKVDFDGRFANPPFVFGSGGVELLSNEMTADLQALKAQAIANPGVPVDLVTKGVDFGSIVADNFGDVDTSAVEGVEDDLVIRAFGRKGEFVTVRAFDVGAMEFHFGMQPMESQGPGDPDGDGVHDEIRPGDLSALSFFLTTLPRPVEDPRGSQAELGFNLFNSIGCTGCHMPALETNSRFLGYRFPEVEDQPYANVFRTVDLSKAPANFKKNANGGITVPLFADLKRHDMGDGLKEDFARAPSEQFNREFTTARLWGIHDSGPYLHDGRALTLTDAILAHGGEAQSVRDGFDALSDDAKIAILTFLRTLRMPIPHGENVRNPRSAFGRDIPAGIQVPNQVIEQPRF